MAGRPVTHAYLINIALLACVLAVLNLALMATRSRSLRDPGEARGETFGADALRFQMMKLRDGFGRIPPNPYGSAKSHVDLMKWSAAAHRVERAAAPPVASDMFIASATAAALGPPLVSPQSWRWLGPGNVGGRIRSLVVYPTKPDTMFAGSVGGGIWKTTNGGARWAPVDDFMAVLSVSSLVINPANPQVMFAGTGEGYGNADSIRGAGIFKSVDGGTTWTQLTATARQFTAVNRLAVSRDGQIVLAGTGAGLWRSTNGSTFTRIASVMTPQDVDFHPANSSRAIAAGYGVITYSTDGGLTWHRSSGLPSTVGRIETAYARSQPDIVYALVDVNGGTLYRSGDGGANFSAVSSTVLLDSSQGWYDAALWVNPKDSNHVIAGGVYLRQTFDGGATWEFISSLHVDQHVIVDDPRFDDVTNKTVFVGNDGGVYKNADIRRAFTGSTFSSLNHNLGVTQFYGGAGSAATGTIVGGTQDNGTVVLQPQNPTRWVSTLGSDGGGVATHPADPSLFYAEMIYLQLFRSDDSGVNWAGISGNLPDAQSASANFIAPFAIDPNDSNRMLAGGASLWRSTNVKSAAPTWKAITGSTPGNPVSAIAIAPGHPNIIWYGRNLGQVYRTAGGTAASPTFGAVGAPTSGAFVTRITISRDDPNVVYVTTGGFLPQNVLKTTDGGATWKDATGTGASGLPNVPVNDLEIDPAHPNTIYVATEVGVFISQDGGTTWDLPQDGPANVAVDELFWMGSTLVAATHGRGMFAADSSGDTPPAMSASPGQLDFGSRTVGTQSPAQRVTITNTGGSPATIVSVGIEGPQARDYTLVNTTCSTTLAAGAACVIETAFKPGAEGPRAASIAIMSNARNGAFAVPLRGVGLASGLDPVPSPWTSKDVGNVGAAGSAGFTQGVFTVTGAGADIWGAADAFHFVSRTLTGDGTLVARAATVQNVNAWTKAGVMIRQNLNANAAHASLFVSPGKGVSFQRRRDAGAATVATTIAGAAPQYVRVVRAGNVVTASVSSNGTAWTTVGRETLTITGPVSVGLAVSSHVQSQLATATFDNVSVK
jgi:photosystem II stability/assembly factor-like uncharacterized protein